MKKIISKISKLLPYFLYLKIFGKINSYNHNPKELKFEEIVESYRNIKQYLEETNAEFFLKLIDDTKVYGEYGVGFSTIFANKYKNKYTIAVDSDQFWVNKVLQNSSSTTPIEISKISLGAVKEFGTPESYDFRHNIKSYLNAIWEKSLKPDLVYIDGRFRVACFLTSLINAEKDTFIIFDDYALRPQYHFVELFEKPIQQNNRQAIFKVSDNYDSEKLEYYIDKFEYVFD